MHDCPFAEVTFGAVLQAPVPITGCKELRDPGSGAAGAYQARIAAESDNIPTRNRSTATSM